MGIQACVVVRTQRLQYQLTLGHKGKIKWQEHTLKAQ